MVLLEVVSCSGVRTLSRGTLLMEVAEGKRGRTLRIENVERGGRVRFNREPWIGVDLQVSRPAGARGLGWNGGKRSAMGGLMIAASSFTGRRGPSKSRITTPRRPVQEEESSSTNESITNEDLQDDSTQRSVEVLDGHLKVPKSDVPADKAAQILQDQFNRFAAAVALADRKMAEDVIREMGDGESPSTSSLDFSDEESLDSMEDLDISAELLDDSLYRVSRAVMVNGRLSEEHVGEAGVPMQVEEVQHSVEDIADLEKELEELYEEVGRMIEEGDDDTARELIEANYEALSEQLDAGVRGVEQAAMLDILAQLYMDMGDCADAEVLLKKTKELLEDIHSPQPLLDVVLEHVASMYSGMGKPEEAIPLYTRSLKIQKRIYGRDNPLLMRTMLGLAKAYSDNDEGSRSIELYQLVVILMERSKGHEDASLVLPLTHLGNTLLEEERVEEAENVLRRAMTLTERAYGARDGRVGVATCALARAKSAQGEVDEAVQLYHEGLDIMNDCSRFPLDDPVMEVVRTDLAEMLNVLGRDAEAQELWQENLRINERVLGKNDIQLVPHLHNAVTSYAHSRDFDKCEPLLRRSLKLMTIHYGLRAPQISIPLELLATSLHHLGRGLEAEALARESVSIRESHYGEQHPVTGEAYNCLAAILHGLKKDNEAENLLRKVLKIQEREGGPDCPEILLTLDLLGRLFYEQGRDSELKQVVRRMQQLEATLKRS